MTYASNKLGVAAGGALMLIVLAACGGSTSSAPAATAPTAAAPAAQPTSAPAATAEASAATSAPAATAEASAATSAPAAAKLNLNDVTEDQLMATIPSFSGRMVREFMEYRPYISIQQFRKEIGKYVSAEQVAAYEQYVYVPVDVDQSDAATLQQLPGVDAAAADALIAGRPYGSNQVFLAKLASLVAAPEAQQAAAFLAAK